jgi:type IV secretory pathway component VirB8
MESAKPYLRAQENRQIAEGIFDHKERKKHRGIAHQYVLLTIIAGAALLAIAVLTPSSGQTTCDLHSALPWLVCR